MVRTRFAAALITSTAAIVGAVAVPASAHGATAAGAQASVWATYPDGSALLSALPAVGFGRLQGKLPTVSVDDTTRYQTVAGIGASLTESSATVLDAAPAAARQAVMQDLFSPTAGIGLSYLRQPLGASDFATSAYSFDDGSPDPGLTRFSTARDQADVLPLVAQAHALDPDLRLMLTPWSAPGWMKDSATMVGGTLLDADRVTYATYLARAVADYASYGAPVDALTLQNEPTYAPPDYPGMPLTVSQEAALADATASALASAGQGSVHLVGNDDNWSTEPRAAALLAAAPALSGAAFHCYAGDVGAQSSFHAAVPSADVYLSECTGGSWGTGFGGDLDWAVSNLLIGGLRNWARTVTMWNAVLDPSGGPHTGGCTGCRGVVTLDPTTGTETRNAEYYALGQVARFVRPGAVRVASSDVPGGLRSVALVDPDGRHVLVVLNQGSAAADFRVIWHGTQARSSLPAGGVETLVW
ncbi:MAG TPA: glycoside hydrolase family 30 beta sandwich domain-containing protein [Acidimicrobiales bacterium]|nr:glycoside hydrolase family 30 beta sandwich domain-containing protein [Acidimicrobiales bacterium]